MPLPSHAHAAADLGRRALLSALPVLLAWPVMMAGRSHDPVFQAIEAARVARDEFTAALEASKAAERDKALLRAADEAADRDTEARAALNSTRPATSAGLHALIRHHAADITLLEPNTFGALALREIAEALPPPPEPERRISGPARAGLIAGEAVALVVMCGGGAAIAQFGHLF